MKNVIDWIKSNPFITACAIVALIGVLGLGYVRFSMVPAFTAEAQDELKKISDQQKRLSGTRVELPNPDINAEPVIWPTVINDKVISDVDQIYQTIGAQFGRIQSDVLEINSGLHQPLMLGGGEIWPDKRNTPAYVQAMVDYRGHFKALFDSNANPWAMPRFRASGPPTRAEVDQVLVQASFNFVNSNGITSAAMLDETQAKMLYDQQRVELMGLLANRARSINLYVTLPAEEDIYAFVEEEDPAASPGRTPVPSNASDRADRYPSGYPFDVADWAFAETPPKPDQLWEGQVQLWILRDIMQVIAKLNRVETGIEVVNEQGVLERQQANVLNSPVKRLLRLQTIPGYVGLHTVGAMFDEGVANEGRRGGFAPSPSQTSGQGSDVYPDPPLDEGGEDLKPLDINKQAKSHFGISPTGHISNAAYDVRHTKLVVDIRWSELPALIEQLREQNFMNVIRADIKDIDEYEILREGYVYGGDDVVRAELLIESLWFRTWTQDLMPKIVREKLLIDLPEGGAQNTSS